MSAPEVVLTSEPCCEHDVRWHHETRGCGYHGHAPEHRCPCLLTADEALEHYVGLRLAAQAAEHEREVAAANEHAIGCERIGVEAIERRILAERALADLRGRLAEVADGWDEAPSILSGVDEWTRGWLRCLEQASAEVRALLASEPQP